jgi:hypothetical protein
MIHLTMERNWTVIPATISTRSRKTSALSGMSENCAYHNLVIGNLIPQNLVMFYIKKCGIASVLSRASNKMRRQWAVSGPKSMIFQNI